MAMSAEGERTFSLPWEQVYPAVLQAIPTVPKMSVRTADQSTGRIQVNKKMGWKSWGEHIFVDVFQPEPGQSTVKVRSEVKARRLGRQQAERAGILEAVARELGVAPAPSA